MRIAIGAVVAAVVAATAAPAAAQLTTYTSRTAFNTAAGSLTTETFKAFTTDVSFSSVPVRVGDFTLSASAGLPQQIDAPPPNSSTFSVDGSTFLNVTSFDGDGFTFTFDRAITAFGASFAFLQDDAIRTVIAAAGQTVTPPQTNGRQVTFYGFVSTVPFTTVTFRGASSMFGDSFGMDDVSFSARAVDGVPEPATWAMLTLGFGGMGMALRRRPRTAARIRFA